MSGMQKKKKKLKTKNRWLAWVYSLLTILCGNKNNSRRPFSSHKNTRSIEENRAFQLGLWEVWIISQLHWEPRLLFDTPSSSFRQVRLITPAAIAKHVWVDQLRNKTVITHSCSCSGHAAREVTLMWTERLERRNAAHSDADSIITNQTFLYVKAQMAPGCLDLMWDLLEI